MNETITIQITYFKDTGKFYTTSQGTFRKKDFEQCIYPRDYGRALLAAKKLPDVVGGVWRYPFAICVDGGYTELMIPEPVESNV